MEYTYQARTPEGNPRSGTIEAATVESALQILQRQNLIVVSLRQASDGGPWFRRSFRIFKRVKQRDVMLLSRQLSTLFEAKVPVVHTLQTLIGESEGTLMKEYLTKMLDDIQGGMSMSQAMGRCPQVFSPFFVNMVKAGEESGKLDEVFIYLADYLERNYELTNKARNSLIYPGFILVAFFSIMMFLFTQIVPKISAIIVESGQELPIYTKIVLAISNFIRSYGIFLLVAVIVAVVYLVRYFRTAEGMVIKSRLQLAFPIVGNLYKKVFLTRIADNLQTLITGGLPIVRALQITADVVGNEIYRGILLEAVENVRGGSTIADAFGKRAEIPVLLTQMIRVGEETGKIDQLLKAISRFYTQEVNSLVENMVSLIEPILILVLGVGVGIVVAAVLTPIYNLTGNFG